MSANLSAQDAETAARTNARAHLGPFIVTPTFTMRDVGVDSNVFNADERPSSDFTFTAVPAFVATAGRTDAGVTLHSTTEFAYFAQAATERSVNEDAGAAARYTLHRLVLTADGDYLNTRQRPSAEIDARSRRVVTQGHAGVGMMVSPKLLATVTGGYVVNAFDADAIFDGSWLAQELNRTERTLGVTLRYRATPLTAVFVTAEAERSRFETVSLRDSDSRRVLAGLDLSPRALLGGSVRVGVQQFRPLNNVVPAFDGLIGSADLRYRLRGSSFGVTLDRSIDYSYIEQQPYYVREGFGGVVRRVLVSRWDVQVSGRRFWHHYRQLADVAATPVTDERFFEWSSEIGYQARPGARVSFAVAYLTRQSDQAARGYSGLHAGTTVTYGF